jgi:hypothetical protein
MIKTTKIDRTLVLNAMIRHETQTIPDLAKDETFGPEADIIHLNYLVQELEGSGHLQQLAGVNPPTYTITKKGIEEGLRLRNANE